MLRKIAVSLILVILLVPAGSQAGNLRPEGCGPDWYGIEDVPCEGCEDGVGSFAVVEGAEVCGVVVLAGDPDFRPSPTSLTWDVLEPWNDPDGNVVCRRNRQNPMYPSDYCARYASPTQIEVWATLSDGPLTERINFYIGEIDAPVQYLPLVEH